MAGYSQTPLAKKLGIKPASRVALLNRPAGLLDGGPPDGLPSGTECRTDLRGTKPFDVIVLFCPSATVLRARFDGARARLTEAGGLWIGWPKKASGVETDLSDGAVRSFGLASGLVDNKTCAIDEVWSGLRFVVRVADRGSHRR